MNWVKILVFLVPKRWGPRAFLTVSCLILFGGLPAYGDESPLVKVAIVVSKNIRPYLEAVEGLEVGLAENSGIKTEVFNLEKLDDVERAELFGDKRVKEFALFAAVGPEAAQSLWGGIGKGDVPRVYCMVLNPEKVVGEKERGCGISLNIPAQTQMTMISRAFPSVRRIGLLYDPTHNTRFFHQAMAAGSFLNLTLVSLTVSSKKDIPSTLSRQWKEMDALWLIPDRTVISESIVNYLSKEAFLRKMPVIGYNRFFYEAGAALAFVFDYKELGLQCAQEAKRILLGENCQDTSPFFHVWVNEKIVEKLGLRRPDAYSPPLELGP